MKFFTVILGLYNKIIGNGVLSRYELFILGTVPTWFLKFIILKFVPLTLNLLLVLLHMLYEFIR